MNPHQQIELAARRRFARPVALTALVHRGDDRFGRKRIASVRERTVSAGALPERSLGDVYDACYCFLDGPFLSLFTLETNRVKR